MLRKVKRSARVARSVLIPTESDRRRLRRQIEAGELEAARRVLVPTIGGRLARGRDLFLLGRLREQEGTLAAVDKHISWELAASSYEQHVALHSEHGEGWFRLGLMYERLKRWPEAAAAYARAVGLRPDLEKWWIRWAWALETTGQQAESRSAYQGALGAGAGGRPYLQELLDLESRDFLYRQRIAVFVAEHLNQLHEAAELASADARGDLGDPVFVYWAQGLPTGSAVVDMCLEQLLRVVPQERLHVLTNANWRHYVDLPSSAAQLQDRDRAHFSDRLRVALLARYGGVWLDATCLLGPEGLSRLDSLRRGSDLFAFRYSGPRISSWCLTSTAGGYLVTMVKAALDAYWEEVGRKEGYFMLHHVFESLCFVDERFAQVWDETPTLSAKPPHVLQQQMFSTDLEDRSRTLLAASFVHKLTYKRIDSRVSADSVLSSLVRQQRAVPFNV